MTRQRRARKPAKSRRRRVFAVRLFVLGVIVVEALWLAGFIRATGSWLPPGLVSGFGQDRARREVWDSRKERRLGDLLIEQAVAREGSRGVSEKPEEPLGGPGR